VEGNPKKIDQSQADRLALDHVTQLGVPAEGYRFALGTRRRVESGWYYDYEIVCDLDVPKDHQAKFAGAFGIFVEEMTGAVSEVSHSQWVDLGLAFHDDPYGA
jgi:hypothetical protein